MNKDEVLNLIRQEIAKNNSGSRFGIQPTTRHIHNNIDAPYVFQPIVSYIGIIVVSEFASTLPSGWKIEKLGTGLTQLTHNLNEFDQIAWLATPIGAGGATIPIPIIVPGLNVVDFSWFDVSTTGAGAPVDTTFMFAAIQVNNKNEVPPKYIVSS